GKWKKILADNIGDAINVHLSVKTEEGIWLKYAPFSIYISPHPIDHGLAYRLIAPGYEVYGKMGIYQRDLSNFSQRAIIENTLIPGSCVNCHSFNQTRTDSMSLHVRGAFGGTIISDRNSLKVIDTRTEGSLAACVYPYWHPSGRFVAYSVNKTQQGFHAAKEELIEVLDLASDIVVLDVESNELFSCEQLSTSALETFPVFSPDGQRLYFCQASEQSLPGDYRNVKYNLCAISFDMSTRTFGSAIDTLIRADEEGFSVSFPKPSFDGQYIMYTRLAYGNFGIWHEEADLYLYDLSDGSVKPLVEANSSQAESYHNWSSNSHWFVFGSRRSDGLYTRPYIASFDKGKTGKPFLLPQQDPDTYLTSLFSYNVPEFISAPIPLNVSMAEKMLKSGRRDKVVMLGR
ncbi:MAG: hypothetical protein LBD21_08275, partial [Tannerellaceae bacterium]|nr:hypothetical protein [Tannerellaceae bacterium]